MKDRWTLIVKKRDYINNKADVADANKNEGQYVRKYKQNNLLHER
jgi:hypothetical protein